MKKLLMIVVAGLFVFSSCGNNKTAETVTTETTVQEECTQGEKGCCKEMTEEQKADMEAWKNWDNQTAEKKQELLAKRKEMIDQKMAEKGECQKEGCSEECKTRNAELKAKMDNWANLTMDEQKALVDGFGGGCNKDGGCKHGA